MREADADVRLEAALSWWARAAVAVVLGVAAVDWVGWATGIDRLTRVFPSWPHMTPWSALLLAALGGAVMAQSGQPSPGRVWVGRGLATAVGVLAVVVLAEYAVGRSFGLDDVWFSHAVHALQSSWPGRPSPQTASSVLMLSVAVAVTRSDRRSTRMVWSLCLAIASAIPFIAVSAYLFDVISLVGITKSTGMGISTALCLLLLVAATVLARPDRNPVAWLLNRPDRRTLLRLGAFLAALPVLVGLSRLAFLTFGMRAEAALVLSITVTTVVLGAATFYLSQREQLLLIEKEQLSRDRAEAEMRYRILADNAVDIVVHLHGAAVVHLQGTAIAWISPSVEAAFGDPPPQWVGSDFSSRVHPDDLDAVLTTLQVIVPGKAVIQRFRVRAADGSYHWVDGHGKSYIDADGNVDGVIVALRIVDDQVEAERQLQQLARFDMLTGLVNRAEILARLEAGLMGPRIAEPQLGVLFCDVDQFKDVNDTWGHAVGDAVLSTMAARIRECVRDGDTVGRMGGDEILVILPGIHSLDEVAEIGEKIRSRAAEPIHHAGVTVNTTLSIGATLSVPGESASTVTARADVAMYQAKQAGRNVVSSI